MELTELQLTDNLALHSGGKLNKSCTGQSAKLFDKKGRPCSQKCLSSLNFLNVIPFVNKSAGLLLVSVYLKKWVL